MNNISDCEHQGTESSDSDSGYFLYAIMVMYTNIHTQKNTACANDGWLKRWYRA